MILGKAERPILEDHWHLAESCDQQWNHTLLSLPLQKIANCRWWWERWEGGARQVESWYQHVDTHNGRGQAQGGRPAMLRIDLWIKRVLVCWEYNFTTSRIRVKLQEVNSASNSPPPHQYSSHIGNISKQPCCEVGKVAVYMIVISTVVT